MVQTLREPRILQVLSKRPSTVGSTAAPLTQLTLTLRTDGSPTSYSRNTNSLGTTGQPAVVYVPSGTYILKSPLQLYVGTVMMGNPLNPPVLKAGYA